MDEAQNLFLNLPTRTSKPRSKGITHMLDKGIPRVTLRSLMELAGPHIDFLKLGWGTAYVSGGVADKIADCRAAGVRVSTGGTLLEIAAAQGKVVEFAQWAQQLGIDTVEVSEGALGLPQPRKQLIHELSRDFSVLAEVGSKDPNDPVVAGEWVAKALEDLEAGAAFVIFEGRESGTVGLYDSDGSVREDLVHALLSDVPRDRIIFEAPRRTQQSWFVREVGVDVNLGNVPPEEILGLETLRRGLRADTAWLGLPSLER